MSEIILGDGQIKSGGDLLIPDAVKFDEYKGFTFLVRPVDDILIGLAKNPDNGVCFSAEGKTRRETGKQLKAFIDLYWQKINHN